jgi:L,D-transpeptidase catalytic domain
VRRSIEVKSSPAQDAPAVGRLDALTPEGTTNIAVVVTGRGREAGALWVPIRAPGVAGWVPRRALGGYETVDVRLVVDTAAFTARLLRGHRVLFRAQVGVGTADAPTPTGSFYVRNKLTRYRSPFYGPLAFGTSARSETLTDWPAGGFIGIHGTSQPELLPGRVSHGCIRLRNDDLLQLARLMPVGTPVTIT